MAQGDTGQAPPHLFPGLSRRYSVLRGCCGIERPGAQSLQHRLSTRGSLGVRCWTEGHWTWALEKLFSQVEGDVNSPPRRGDGASQGPCWGHHRQLWERVRGREQWEVSQGTSWTWGLEAWGSLWGLS